MFLFRTLAAATTKESDVGIPLWASLSENIIAFFSFLVDELLWLGLASSWKLF